jgi:hypothetical protein
MPSPLLIPALVGLGFQVVGQQQKRAAEARQLDLAAKNLYTEAAQTMRQGEYVSWIRALDLEQRMGALTVAGGAGGVDAGYGSAATAKAMTQTFGRLDVDMERLNAARKARGIRLHAAQMEEQADEMRSQGFMDDVATVLGGGASLYKTFGGA